MDTLPDYKLKIFADALQAHFNQESISDFAEDDLAASAEDWLLYDESKKKMEKNRGGQGGQKKARKAWKKTEAGRTYKRVHDKIWYETDKGKACIQRELAAQRVKSLDHYLNRRIVALDSEGRCPLHMIDANGRTPLEAYRETSFVLKYLTKDSSGHYWEPHELSLIGAASIDRPYGTPIEKGTWGPPVWAGIKPKGQSEQSEQCFEFLLSASEQFKDEMGRPPLYIMFSASYDWSTWLRDTPFGKAFEIARQRGFEPPCKRMRGMVFWQKNAIKIRPYYDFKLFELRWPGDPYGKNHKGRSCIQQKNQAAVHPQNNDRRYISVRAYAIY